MSPFLVGALLVVVAFAIYRITQDRWNAWEVVGWFGLFVALIGATILVIAGAVAIANQATITGDLAQIAQLRAAAHDVDLSASEDVAGKVADFNVTLASTKWWNKTWLGDPFIHDAYDTISYIPMRRGTP